MGAVIIGRSINRFNEISPIVVTTISMAIGSAVLLPIGIWVQGFLVISPLAHYCMACRGEYGCSLYPWNFILRTLSAAESSMISNTMTIWIPVLAVLFLSETLNFRQIDALILVVIGTLAAQIKRISRKKRLVVIDQGGMY